MINRYTLGRTSFPGGEGNLSFRHVESCAPTVFTVELGSNPVYGFQRMRQQCLIDLYVHSSTGAADEIADAASSEGFDAVCYVLDAADEVPDRDVFEQASERGRASIFPGFEIVISGSRYVVLIPTWEEAPWEAFEALGDTQLLAEAVVELGGVLVPMCPHQATDGEALSRCDSIPHNHPVGWVAMVVKGSQLGRHLDIEEASIAGRRILGATGPFGRADDMGRYATLLPSRSNGIEDVVDALNAGLGVCVELRRPVEVPAPKKRSRRRRRPRRNQRGTSQGQESR